MARAKHTEAAMERLFPTRSRLALLAAIKRGDVYRQWTHDYLRPEHRKVDARTSEVARVDWAWFTHAKGDMGWKLTPEGERVLRTYGGTDG